MTNSNFGPLSGEALRIQQNEEIQELHRQLKEKDRIFENYKKQRGGLEVFFRQVKDSIQPVSPLSNKYNPKIGKKKTPISAVMQTSDSHMGAVQNHDEIEGLNEYNPQICENRNMGFATSAVNYFETLRSAYPIPTLHWLFTGDLISGDIHQELLITNAFPSPVQVVEAARVHAKQVGFVAPYFERVVIHFITADNHGRLTKKPQAAEEGRNSYNYLVGILMQEYLKRHSNVEFNLYPVHEKVIRIENLNYLLMHGHSIRGWMGVPWYGIERKAGKESAVRMAAIMQAQEHEIMNRAKQIGFHKMIHGHFHVNFDGPLYSCAASVQGTTTYDHNNARFSEPGQPAWLIHPEHGDFARTNFRLKFYDQIPSGSV
jgi:hypothetical protein